MSPLVLPRPGTSFTPTPPIPGPFESSFTRVFGRVLPPAQFLTTSGGKAAYYSIAPRAESSDNGAAPARVLFIHGVQTPALGMFPLAHALHASFPSAHFVLLDLWGHGLSDAPVCAYEAGVFHLLIDDLLARLGWAEVHLLGYSFGGALTAGYVATRAERVQSFALVAPAGLIRRDVFGAEQQVLLSGRDGEDADEVRKCVLGILEGGELVVPLDWEERVARGEVVAEAVRDWQLREHAGHAAAVVAIFRDGGVLENDATFSAGVKTGVRNVVVLGELDYVVGKEQLVGLGFKDVHAVEGSGHGVVRERVSEVKALVEEFWKGL